MSGEPNEILFGALEKNSFLLWPSSAQHPLWSTVVAASCWHLALSLLVASPLFTLFAPPLCSGALLILQWRNVALNPGSMLAQGISNWQTHDLVSLVILRGRVHPSSRLISSPASLRSRHNLFFIFFFRLCFRSLTAEGNKVKFTGHYATIV